MAVLQIIQISQKPPIERIYNLYLTKSKAFKHISISFWPLRFAGPQIVHDVIVQIMRFWHPSFRNHHNGH